MNDVFGVTSWLKRFVQEDFQNSSAFVWMAVLITLFVVFLSVVYMIKTRVPNRVVSIPEVHSNRKYRFRKREKVEFYARKVLRKGKDTASKLQRQVSLIKQGVSVPEYSRSGRRLEKRERMMILAKKVFSGRKKPSLLKKKELPSQLLEADITDEGIQPLPDEVLYLLQSVKVFGHFEKGVFLQLCRHMETLHLNAGEHLFKVGEADKWLYVVQEGQVDLYIVQDGTEVKLSEVSVGESLHSLLSILDVLTGHPAPYKTVLARAVKKSIVIRLPAEAFSEAFRNRKESLVQIVQVIMTRLQRVTFLALHNYLGLSQELLKPNDNHADKLKIRKQSSTQALFSLLEKHRLSSSTLEEQLGITALDKLPARQSTSVKSLPCETSPAGLRSMSLPTSTVESPSKVKQLRFTEVDTVVDEGDNVFHRQSSFPLNQRQFLKENIKKARTIASAESLMSVDSCDINDSTSSLEGSDRQFTQMYMLNEPEVLELVTQDLALIFGIDNDETLRENVYLLKVRKDFKLVSEGEQDVSLYFVVTGLLKVTQTLPEVGYEEQQEVLLFNAKPGMITGQLAVLTGEHSFFGVTAVSDSVVACIARHKFYKMMQKYPHMVLNTAHTVMERVSPFVRQIDFALDWLVVEAGKPLYKQNSSSDCMYIVLHGRLRSVCTKPDGKKELVAEFGKGEIVGMNEALRGTPRPSSLHAVRDTELAKIPEGLIKHIRSNHPSVVFRLVSLMSDKLLVNLLSQKRQPILNQTIDFHTHTHHVPEETELAYGNVSNHLANLSTVAILPASPDVPLDKFSMELHHALTHICGNSVLRLHSKLVKQRLGNNALDSVHDYRLSNWLAHHEDMHDIVLYQTDVHMSPWTQRCIRQADAILIVALGDNEPSVGELESQVEGMAVRALKMLVLLHRPTVVRPTRTVDWLNMRGWLTDHMHIKGSKKLFAKTKKSKMEEYWMKVSSKPVNKFSDFSRLARFLTGTTIALVLGGGGARGLSHTGIMQSLMTSGIPFDMVGGTSIGAFIGGLWAAHRDIETVRERTLILCKDMSSIVSKLFDLTYPFTSMFSGSAFNKAIKQVYEDIQIEDLWVPYFTITTDITSSEMKVHTDGWLWRYVRSSMSLSGYLPPLCDPKDGHLLMDGGYINNLPGDVAHARGARRVIAVDVGAQDDQDFTNYGDSLSGWWLLWKRLSGRWTGRVKVPDLNDIQSRLSYISCNYLLEKVIHSEYCYYVRPPISTYKTLEFHKHQELFEVGVKHGQGIFTNEWCKKFWKDLLQDRSGIPSQHSSSKGRLDISFTDLSEVVQLDGKSDVRILSDFDSDNEFELGYESSPEVFFSTSSNLRRLQSEPHDMYKLTSLSDVEGTSVTRTGSADSFHRLPHERRSSLGEERSAGLMDFSTDDDDDTDSGRAFSSS